MHTVHSRPCANLCHCCVRAGWRQWCEMCSRWESWWLASCLSSSNQWWGRAAWWPSWTMPQRGGDSTFGSEFSLAPPYTHIRTPGGLSVCLYRMSCSCILSLRLSTPLLSSLCLHLSSVHIMNTSLFLSLFFSSSLSLFLSLSFCLSPSPSLPLSLSFSHSVHLHGCVCISVCGLCQMMAWWRVCVCVCVWDRKSVV